MAMLKRLVAPKYWKIERKKYTWAVTPRAGPHPKNFCIPLLVIVRDVLEFAETYKEAKHIIKKGEVYVDGKPRKDHKYPAGLFDVVGFPKIEKYYRIVPFEKGLKLIEIDKNEANMKICKVKNKVMVKDKKIQLTFHDGKTLLTENNNIKPHDSVLLKLPSLKIIDHLPLKSNMVATTIKGELAGKVLKVEKIIEGSFTKKWEVEVIFDTQRKRVIREHVIVVGKEEPLIKIGE